MALARVPYLPPRAARTTEPRATRDDMASPAPSAPAADGNAARPAPSAAGLRVALYSGNYNSVRDGANKALNRLVAHLLARGAAVRVYAPRDPHRRFEAPGDIVAVPSKPIPTRPEYRVSFGLGRAVREDIAAFRPNVMHLAVPDVTGWQAQNLARRLGIPIVASLHTLFETYFEYYGFGFLRGLSEKYLAKFYSRCDLVLAPNRAVADDVARSSPGVRAEVWGRGVDQQFFSPAHRDLAWRRAHGYADDAVVIAFFGRVVLEKGTQLFAEVIAELRRRGHHVVPLLIGDGPDRERLAGLLGDAVFAGHLEGHALSRAIASADIVVNPSVTEAFGNVNLEAMASGVAVVAADLPVTRTMIDNGESGLLVDARSVAEYSDAAERLVTDGALRRRLAANARTAAEAYDWSAILDGVIAHYWSLVKPEARDGH